MKTTIITIPDFTNYGNRLQNYASQYVISQISRDCTSLRVETRNPLSNKFKGQVRSILSLTLPKLLYKKKPSSIRYTYFEQFTKKNITKKVYKFDNLKIPCSVNTIFDYFIVGSDQVWNPTFWGVDNEETLFNNYLLAFALPEKRISYAASFGISEIPLEWKEGFKKELSKFKAISVREEDGAKIVKELTDRNVEVLIDPTMMLSADMWRSVAKRARARKGKNRPYILKYFLGNQTEELRTYIQSIANKNKLEVYELLDIQYPELYTTGPDEFLDLIDNATLICTDSFHATAFSILFSKPFLVMNREQKGMNNMSSRISTLLSKLHLEYRMPGQVKENEIFECDYNEAYQALEKERAKAIAFLKKAMSLE